LLTGHPIGETLGKLADSGDGLKAQRAKNISSGKWHQAVQARIAAYDGLVRDYEGKKSQISISLLLCAWSWYSMVM
jgi:hypothetical protein